MSEVRVPVLSIVCEPRGRRERYDVERLMRQFGWDAKLTDLLRNLWRTAPRGGRPVLMRGAKRCLRGGDDAPLELCGKVGDGVN